MKEKFLNRILIFSFILFVLSIVFFVYFIYFRPTPASDLKIGLTGPNEVLSLENYDYKIEIVNGSNKKLTDVTLKISLSDGAFLVNNPQEKNLSLFLGEIEQQKTNVQNLSLFFVNAGDLKENLKIVLNYKIEDKDHIFAKEENFSILVKNPPIKAQIFLPTKIYVNQEFQANFRIINLTKQKLNNIKVSIETPTHFLLTSSFPQTENFYWEFPSLDTEEIKNVSLIGQIQNSKSSGIFSIKVDFSYQNFSFSLTKEIAKINVLENPIVFYIKSTPESKNINIGSSLFYEIILENKSQTILENGQVKIIFSGPFDFYSLNTDGYFNEFEQAIYWTSRNKPELLVLKPGDRVKFNFAVSLFRSYPILGENNKNFTTKIRAEFRTPSIPIEIEEGGREYFVFQEDEKRIIGDINLESKLVYQDPIFVPEGPFPLQPNQPSTLIWHLKIKSIGEDFDNLTIKTRLPMGVNFTGKVGGDAILDNLKYDSKTGAFIYQINKLPANLGYVNKELDLAFQILVELPANVEPQSFIIIPQAEYSATGSFSQGVIQKTINPISVGQVLYQ
ncbi:MAG: hypothetical protein KatS3mg096_027 [Candidatus Parcubacteria bacterium]|nr:MAG: hypothetical protein KatS3mg096_027 [Candidatus Parcubacteria bacterium]